MEKAARTGGTFHLWWHPENFGRNLRQNIAILTKVLDRFQSLKDEYGLQSRAMRDIGGAEQSRRAAIQEGSRAA
jgi:hypothetical protein